MGISATWQQRQIAACLVIFLGAPFAQAAIAQPVPVRSGQQATTAPATQAPNADNANSKPTTNTSQPVATPSETSSSSSNEADQDETSTALPSAPQQQQNGTSNPVGTAAAPYEKPTGVAASRPAGAVVAPAKQKRSRSFLIRVGLIVGACVAVGVVVGLSAASPSRP
jgi:cytoskeletal protein RodZ